MAQDIAEWKIWGQRNTKPGGCYGNYDRDATHKAFRPGEAYRSLASPSCIIIKFVPRLFKIACLRLHVIPNAEKQIRSLKKLLGRFGAGFTTA